MTAATIQRFASEWSQGALDLEFEIIKQMGELAEAENSLKLKQLALLEQGADGPINGKNAELRALQLEFHCEEEMEVVRTIQAVIAEHKANLRNSERMFQLHLALLQRTDRTSAN